MEVHLSLGLVKSKGRDGGGPRLGRRKWVQRGHRLGGPDGRERGDHKRVMSSASLGKFCSVGS